MFAESALRTQQRIRKGRERKIAGIDCSCHGSTAPANSLSDIFSYGSTAKKIKSLSLLDFLTDRRRPSTIPFLQNYKM